MTSLPFSKRLIEIRQTRELSKDHLRPLYLARIPIILLNPLTTPLTVLSPNTTSGTKSAVLPYPLPPHAILLITSPSPISSSSSVQPPILRFGVSPTRVFLIDPARALSSIRALRTNLSDALHVYADDAVGSGLSALKRQLQYIPTAVQKGDALVSGVLNMLGNGPHSAEAELHDAAGLARALRSAREDAQPAMFGPTYKTVRLTSQPSSPTAQYGNSSNKVRWAVAHAVRNMQPVLDRLTRWHVLRALDDAGRGGTYGLGASLAGCCPRSQRCRALSDTRQTPRVRSQALRSRQRYDPACRSTCQKSARMRWHSPSSSSPCTGDGSLRLELALRVEAAESCDCECGGWLGPPAKELSLA